MFGLNSQELGLLTVFFIDKILSLTLSICCLATMLKSRFQAQNLYYFSDLN